MICSSLATPLASPGNDGPRVTLPRSPPQPRKTLLYFGCTASYQDVRILPAMLKIAAAAGVEFTTLAAEETCCVVIWRIDRRHGFLPGRRPKEPGPLPGQGGRPRHKHLRRLPSDLR